MLNSPATLYEKTQGPNALPVAALIARAEEAVAEVKRDYLPFLKSRLPDLNALSGGAACGSSDRWDRLAMAAHDLRSSSATAGYDQLAAVASSLEWLLKEAPGDDPRVAAVVRLHLDAIVRLIAEGAPQMASPKVQELLSELARASNHVTRGHA